MPVSSGKTVSGIRETHCRLMILDFVVLFMSVFHCTHSTVSFDDSAADVTQCILCVGSSGYEVMYDLI
jgi:hypothetical protein